MPHGQEVLRYSALKFGLEAVILPVGAAVGAAGGQALVTRHGPRAVSAGPRLAASSGRERAIARGTSGWVVRRSIAAFGIALGVVATAYSIATLPLSICSPSP